jgi:methanol metabolism-related c-type cytochrome
VKRPNFAPAILVAVVLAFGVTRAAADGSGDPKAVKEDNGKYFGKDDTPTFKIENDGTVDWYTYSGFRRYHSDCHVCHGPDGEGSTYAPGLKDALKSISYADFVGAVASGRKNVNTAAEKVMPAFGTNPNVMCYIDDIFIYLRARANDTVSRGRPAKRAEKPKAAEEAEIKCLGPAR